MTKSKKAIASEVLVIVLLLVALAVIAIMWLAWGSRGKDTLSILSKMFPFQ